MGFIAVHVVDDDWRRRAEMSRAVLAIGHHAEIYSSSAELVDHLPEGGVVIASEGVISGGTSNLVNLLQRHGRVLGVIASSTEPSIEGAISALRSGASDYLALPVDGNRLACAIAQAASLADGVRAERLAQSYAATRVALLTPRERTVLELVADGLTNRQIGEKLQISTRTIEVHRDNLMKKLDAVNSVAAVRLYLQSIK